MMTGLHSLAFQSALQLFWSQSIFKGDSMPFIYETTKELQLISEEGKKIEAIPFIWSQERQESLLADTSKLFSWFKAHGSMNWHRDIPGDLDKFEQRSKPSGTSEPFAKPQAEYIRSPNQSSRNGVSIKRIVLHYTTSRNLNGTISWFRNPASRVSAHYCIGRDGKLVQMVNDDKKAWHAAGANADTIGIENSAEPGDRLAEAQEKKLIELLNWLCSEYKLSKSAITGHRFLGNNTSCPGDLWKTQDELNSWVDEHVSID